MDKVAGSIRHTADALGEINRVLKGAADGDWRGKAAIAFRELLDDDFRPKIEDAYDSFDQAKRVIQGWSDYMEDKQKKARSLEREAAEAKNSADKAKQAESDGEKKKPTSGSDDSSDPVEDVRKRARTLHAEYEEEGKNSAKRLQKAIDIAPNEPGFWEKLGESISNAFDAIADAAAWLHDQAIELLGKLAPLLDLIGDIAGLLSAVTGLLALIPGLQFLGAASLVLAGVALGAHYLSAVGTTGSFGKALLTKDVIMDAVGFGLGKAGAMLGDGILAAAKASGAPTRMVPQLIGSAKELPMGYFQLASSSYAMGQSEFLWRTGQYFTTWTGNVMTAEGGGDSVETLGKIFSWDFGPLTQKPKVTN
ncbi:WXG100 family type VII secretion target [Streptomyces justiciae]|nr:WXG100 family type VII secretion target [Streptomyces justiciae]MCW8379531.1 WXG100 family type VII secretion target [Streptomyces justiciae]